jgi:hypothetical protein
MHFSVHLVIACWIFYYYYISSSRLVALYRLHWCKQRSKNILVPCSDPIKIKTMCIVQMLAMYEQFVHCTCTVLARNCHCF